MLVKFKPDYEKITMGLLSYVPDLKETSRLTSELDWYKQDDGRQLYLWKSQETGDMAGVLGVEEEENLVLLRHISINPSYRQEGMAYSMLNVLADQYDSKKIVGTIETGPIVTKWQKRNTQEELENQDTADEEE